MKDWSGLVVIVLALLLFIFWRLLKDTDPRLMNPRFESDRGTKPWQKFQLNDFLTLGASFIISYILVRIVKWIWPH